MIACASPNGAPCDIKTNAAEIMRLIKSLPEAEIILFPRLALSSASCGDLFLQKALIIACENALKDILKTVGDKLVVLGLPVEYGKGNLLDLAAVLHSGKILRFVPLKNPKYPFSQDFPNSLNGIALSDEPFMFKGKRIFVGRLGDENSISLIPSDKPYLAGDDISVYDWLKNTSKNKVVALAQAGVAESGTDYCFGGICGVGENGRIKAYRRAFSKEDHCISQTDVDIDIPKSECFLDQKTPYLQGDKLQVLEDFIRIPAQALALRLKRIGSKNMVLGLSGGLDSTIALLIAAEARKILSLDKSSLHIYTLPAQGTGKKTLSNADMLCSALDIPLNTINISNAVKNHLRDIGHSGLEDAAFENAQARERTQILMDISNMVNGIMIGTGDMSELALGFTTYGGDHMSMYSVNSGLLKTMIRMAVWQLATNKKELSKALFSVLNTPISPELKSGVQHTEEILGPYILNDFFLYYVLKGFAPDEIISLAVPTFNGDYTKDILIKRLKFFYKRFFTNQFKRSCLPDGPRVWEYSLSPREGFKMPSDARANIFTDLLN
ncbi:MAG: NAD(+) synthase [Eubacteriales bacterium]|nr:NAD(+) synthase [Eubacteriales bacterium]